MEKRCEISWTELPWYPHIDAEKCRGCKTCFKFCKYGALAFNITARKVRVKYPSRCQAGCRICAGFCPIRAIAFPDESEFVDCFMKRLSN
ncbi:MAG: 4Fe-4S [Geobacteraceae bacterium]|nr:MAG: 4Fe-4S [Geobacteraceae bacterium]